MEIYTLDREFLPREFITQFASVIWTERYSSAGDVELVVASKPEMASALSPGTFLGLKGTKEIMVLETHSIEKELLTVKGSSLVKYFNEREAWFPNPLYDGSDTTVALAAEYTTDTQAAGAFLADVLNRTVISPAAFGSFWSPIDFDWANDAIAGLALGLVDGNGTVKRLSFPLGPLYDGIENFAQAERLGFKLYLESAVYSTHTHVLRFASYRGRNRTSDQTVNSMVRLTPQMDSLYDVKELTSIGNYKNVVYVNYKNQISVHYIGSTIPTGFERRVLRVDAPDIYLDPTHVAAFRAQVAYNAFVQHMFIQAVDGQVSTQPGYKFEKDYYLGDVVELEGTSGLRSKAQVTEYIRSQDEHGVREYPTLSVIDPVLFDFEADLEPDPDFEIPWFDDPDFTWDFPDPPFDDPTFDDPIFDDPPIDDHTISDSSSTHKRRRRHPKDPNPDPSPDFTHELGPARIIIGYYPDQMGNEQIGKITADGELGPLWVYTTEDPTTDSSSGEIIPLRWTADNAKIIAQSRDSKSPTDDYPWSNGWVYWLMNPDGSDHIRLTDTITSGVYGFLTLNEAVIWSDSDANRELIINRGVSSVEYVYADGTYSPYNNLHSEHSTTWSMIDDPGPLLGSGHVIEVKRSTTGALSDLETILGTDDFTSPNMRWTSPILGLSPDGSKLYFTRSNSGPNEAGRPWLWNLGGSSGIGSPGLYTPEPVFRVAAGIFGDYFGGIYSFGIPWNSTAEEVWNGIHTGQSEFSTPILADPRDYGYPSTPYAGGPLPTPVLVQFQVLAEGGVWMDIDNHDLINDVYLNYQIGQSTEFLTDQGPTHSFLCNSDGSELTELDLGNVNDYIGWTPDSTKIILVVPSASGLKPEARFLVYDVASEDISYPVDYSTEPGSLGRHAWISPDSSKIVWRVIFDDGSGELWVANLDGSDATQLYTQEAGADYSDQDLLFISNYGAWSFDSTKFAMTDFRDPAPVWIIDVSTGVKTKAFAGVGWDNPDDQRWIYDLVNFNG